MNNKKKKKETTTPNNYFMEAAILLERAKKEYIRHVDIATAEYDKIQKKATTMDERKGAAAAYEHSLDVAGKEYKKNRTIAHAKYYNAQDYYHNTYGGEK